MPCYTNEANIEKGLLTIWTVRDIPAGEELCFSYFGQPEESDFRPMVGIPRVCTRRRLTIFFCCTEQEGAGEARQDQVALPVRREAVHWAHVEI